MSRRLLRRLALVAGCLGALLGPVTAASAQEAQPPPVPVLDWESCEGGFECARALAPRDYRNPSGPRLSLALIRRPALDPERRIGSLFVNPGGPGGSGVDLARYSYADLPAELRRRFDLVGFDPRGVARSAPLRCWNSARYRRAFTEVRARTSSRAFPRTVSEARLRPRVPAGERRPAPLRRHRVRGARPRPAAGSGR